MDELLGMVILSLYGLSITWLVAVVTSVVMLLKSRDNSEDMERRRLAVEKVFER